MILSLDTSASQLLLALYDAKQKKMAAELMLDSPLTHGQSLMASVNFLLAQLPGAKLSGLGVCVGPGSFTGLRVGLATVQGLAFALGLKVAAISSLEIMAMSFGPLPHTVWAIMDARQNMLYAAPFIWQKGELRRVAGDGAASLDRLKELIVAPACLLGGGALLYGEQLAGPGIEIMPEFKPARGLVLAELSNMAFARGLLMEPEELRPNYCRPSEAEARFGLPLESYNLL